MGSFLPSPVSQTLSKLLIGTHWNATGIQVKPHLRSAFQPLALFFAVIKVSSGDRMKVATLERLNQRGLSKTLAGR